jgi:hypothetical protein
MAQRCAIVVKARCSSALLQQLQHAVADGLAGELEGLTLAFVAARRV